MNTGSTRLIGADGRQKHVLVLEKRKLTLHINSICDKTPLTNTNYIVSHVCSNFSDMEFLEVLTEGLERILMIRGGGREVITIYS